MGFVLVGVDSSSTSRKAFHEAIRQATWREASVVAMHVVHYPYFMGYEYAAVDIDVLETSGKDRLASEIASLASEYGGEFPVPVETKLVIGHSGVELTKAAAGGKGTEPAELVVLGTRGYGGFRGLLVGSVTTYALHHLDCPLLVVPPDETDD